jgi:hypothetical protein
VFHTDLPSETEISPVPPCEREGMAKIKQNVVKTAILIIAFLQKIRVFKVPVKSQRLLELKLYIEAFPDKL